jgi:hypothetical protein
VEIWDNAADLVNRIAAAYHGRRLSHALLLVADCGQVARELGEAVVRIFLPPRSPDLLRLEPEGKSWQITADAARMAQGHVYKTSCGAVGVRVVLIQEANRLHRTAANAMLKAVEEPPFGVFFVLTTDRLGDILPTLRSRCSTFHNRGGGTWMLPEPLQAWMEDFRHLCQERRSRASRILDGHALLSRLIAALDALCPRDRSVGDGEMVRRCHLLALLAGCGEVFFTTALDSSTAERNGRKKAVLRLERQIATVDLAKTLLAVNCPEMAVLESVLFAAD